MIKMKKSLLFLSLLLILCISLGSVSAADISVNDIDSIDTIQNDEIVSEDSSRSVGNGQNVDIVSEDSSRSVGNGQNVDIVSEDSSQKDVDSISLQENPTPLSELQEEIDNADPNAIITLTTDYKSNIPFILIDIPLTIDGQGHTIEGNSAQIFWVYSDNITLKNINFINAKFNGNGSTIYCGGSNCSVVNCSFVNCSAGKGTIYCGGSNCSVVDCSFVNCSSVEGAIYWYSGDNGTVSGCSFVNCSANENGGAISWVYSNDGVVSGCSFVNCSANENGGAISWVYSNDGVVSGCSFVNCSANDEGGAIEWWDSANGVVNYNIFDNNIAKYDGNAIYTHKSIDCDFNFFAFENNITSFPKDLITGSTVNNWVVLNITKNNTKYSVDFVSNNGSTLTKSMPNYTARLNINEDVKEITIKNNTFKDDRVNGNYLLNSFNSGNVLVRTTLNWNITDYNVSTSDCVYGGNATVTVKVNPSATGNITVKVDDDQVFTGIVDNGVVTIYISNLNVGVHNLNIYYSGDMNYLPFDTTANLTVNNAMGSFNICVSDIVYGDSFVINITNAVGVNDEKLSGIVKVNVNGTVYDVDVTEGSGFKLVDDILSCGNYTVSASLTVPNYDVISSNTSFVVNKVCTVVSVSVENITYGEDAIVNGVVSDVDGNVVDGEVILFVNGVKRVILPVKDGKFSTGLCDLSAGVYNIAVVYNGDDIYSYSDATANLTVNKANTTVSIGDKNISYVDVAVFKGNVNGVDGKVGPSGKLSLFFNGTDKATIPVSDGSFDVEFYGLDVGVYNIDVVYEGDDNYLPSNTTVNLIINRAKTIVSVSVENIVYGEGAIFNVTFDSPRSIFGPTGNVIFFVNGTKNVTVPVIDDKCNVIIHNLSSGVYNIAVVYEGDGNYLSSNASTNLTVYSLNGSFDIAVNDIVYGDSFIINIANATGVNGTLLNGTVDVTIEGNVYSFNVTDGVASYEVSDILPAGNYRVNASLVVPNYDVMVANTSFIIDKISTKFVDATNGTVYNGKYYSVRLTDDSGNALVSKNVTINIAGKDYNVTTDKNGLAKVELALTNNYINKSLTVTYKFLGDNNFKASSGSSNIKVIKTATKITNATKLVVKNHKNFYVKLTTKAGKVLANKVIKMKSTVSGKTYKIKTNSKGIAKIDLWVKKQPLGKYYKYTFRYAGSTYYKSCTKTFKIKIVK